VAIEHMCVAAERQLIAERMLSRAEAAGNQRGKEHARMSIDTAQRQHRSGHADAREAQVHATTPQHPGELEVVPID
jgi:hypothetical protein